MIGIAILIGVALVLVGLLFWITRDGETEFESEAAYTRVVGDGAPRHLYREFVGCIFSSEDRDFVRRTGSVRLERLYREERKTVALHWVLGTARGVTRIMQGHRLRSRQSPDLEVRAEAKLMLQYLKLRILCGLLVVLVRVFGPHALGDLAAQANGLYQGIGRLVSESALVPDVTAETSRTEFR